MKVPATITLTVLALTLSACVYVPSVKERDAAEAECKTLTQSMSMDAIEVGTHADCHGEDCTAMLAGIVIVSAGSAIISGSIVLTGNTIHWLEYQGTCSDGYLGKTKRLFLETFSKEKTATASK